ncbi:hypothetical protein E4U17_003005 [Claviceps sp. LM77 group G4]|nr:hypothetical protein E4U17_003005 [Claviceps sp. LM77 group G4]KAG6075754.1 hypothetical protein E4U16_003182 [Claviceps sp. LM84 group G4]KAG6081484.1 hypothetical protein E4U33_006808 [Claviceps sp. LM78 group G4]
MFAPLSFQLKRCAREDLTVNRATVRYASAMAGRLFASTTANPITKRAFSSAIPLRSTPPKRSPFQGSLSDNARSNPLVGDYVPDEPASPHQNRNPTSTSRVFIFDPPPSPTTSGSILDAPASSSPPPPPPPSLDSSKAEEELPKQNQTSHSYDANNSILLTDIISGKTEKNLKAKPMINPLDEPVLRSRALTGRTIFIKDRVTPQSAPTPMVAVRLLDRLCREQKIREKYHSQKFYERKGDKRKRLSSLRWRARFKAGFKAVVSRVVELKRQGW